MCFKKKKNNKVFAQPIIFIEDFIPNNDKDICPICLDEITDNFSKLECNHDFHINCIMKWYEKSLDCPICRTPTNNADSSLIRYKSIMNRLVELKSITRNEADYNIQKFINHINQIYKRN